FGHTGRILHFPRVVDELTFGRVPVKVLPAHVVIGAGDRTLEQGEEAFRRVRVDPEPVPVTASILTGAVVHAAVSRESGDSLRVDVQFIRDDAGGSVYALI